MKERLKSYIIEKRGTYKGFDYAVTFTWSGHRCGYIILPKPIQDKRYLDVDSILDLHCGLSFLDYHNLDTENPDKQEFAIGWDYGHACDGKDMLKAMQLFPDLMNPSLMKGLTEISKGNHVYTTEEVERDCRRAIDLIEKKRSQFDKFMEEK